MGLSDTEARTRHVAKRAVMPAYPNPEVGPAGKRRTRTIVHCLYVRVAGRGICEGLCSTGDAWSERRGPDGGLRGRTWTSGPPQGPGCHTYQLVGAIMGSAWMGPRRTRCRIVPGR